MKDLLLFLSDLWILNEAISQAMKYNNRLFQRHQDQCSKQHMARHAPTISTSSLNSHLEMKDMQIDTICVKFLTPKEKKWLIEEGLCLYGRREGLKAGNYPKKKNWYNVKTRGAFIQKNEDSQP